MSDIPDGVREDLERLFDLLSLLPDPDDEANRDWWEAFAEAEQSTRYPLQEENTSTDYILSKLGRYPQVSGAWQVRSLAMYCLMFFDSPSPKMIKVVESRMNSLSSGLRLLDSICEVAWRIYVPLEAADRRANR